MSGKQRIDQLLAGFADGDATSQMAVVLRDVFRRWGHPSDLFVPPDRASPTLQGQFRPLSEFAGAGGNIVLHHYGIRSPASAAFEAAGGGVKRILVYHNITPPEYFRGFDDALAEELRQARADLARLGQQADAAWAVSQFNAAELKAAGAKNVSVLPLTFSAATLDLAPDPEVLKRFDVPLKTILAVGRVAPNKRLEDLIQAFGWYNKSINPYSRLVIVGSVHSTPRYWTMLQMLVGDLDVANICFEGFASPAGLAAYYCVADVFVSTSEHEGYCLPLVEAMYKGIPVISRNAGGTPEALDSTGVQYDELAPRELAELIHLVLTDEDLRVDILHRQGNRIQAELMRDLEGELRDLLKMFVRA
ncbi:MAG: glycosyltransferase [Verrucomicrobiota bacterium]